MMTRSQDDVLVLLDRSSNAKLRLEEIDPCLLIEDGKSSG